MRSPKALILPFFCEGYDREEALAQLDRVANLIQKAGVETETAELICDVKEAEAASLAYNPFRYDLAVLYPTTWSEPRLACVAARQFFGKPLAIWCVDEFVYQGRRVEMSAAPAAAALHGSLQEMGVMSELFVGQTPDEERDGRFFALADAARALSLLRGAKFGFYGQNFNGITAADFDLSLLRRRFGTEVYTFDGSDLIRRMESLDPASPAFLAERERVSALLAGSTGEHLDRIVRMCLGLRDTVAEYDLCALDVRCHTEFSQSYGLSACIPLSVLGNDFTTSCEADLPVIFTQYLLHLLSGGKVAAYVDLRTFHKDGMDVGACGMAPSSLTGNKIEVSGPEAPGNGNPPGFLCNKSSFNPGRVSLARVLKFPAGKLGLHFTPATAEKMSGPIQEMGCPFYPMARVKPDMPMDRFLENVGANHYALVYDDVTLAADFFCRYAGMDLIR
ncbi:MAG: hypothetical protein J6Z79_00535 [Clostridia bacterium]|nr:hypothetical protein [Clostridia bacterium]